MLQREPSANRMWPISASYNIEAGQVKPSGKRRFYHPLRDTKLHFELANVESESDVIQFCRDYGSLFTPSGDRARMILAHGATLKAVLSAHEALLDGDKSEDELVELVRELGTRMRTHVRGDGADAVPSGAFSWHYADGPKTIGMTLIMEDAPAFDVLRTMVEVAVNSNLKTVSPVIRQPMDSAGLFNLSLRWTTLAEVAWWHVANFVARAGRVAQCEACSSLFEQTRPGQRFCPPEPEQRRDAAMGIGRAQSRCAVRKRNEKYRAKKAKTGKDATNGN